MSLPRNNSSDIKNLFCAINSNCEKQFNNSAEGTAKHTLLKRRIAAFNVAMKLLNNTCDYQLNELEVAIMPLQSIRNKSLNAMKRHHEKSATFKRLKGIVEAMEFALLLIDNAIKRK